MGDEATSTRRKNKESREQRERIDYVLSRLAQSFFYIVSAGVAELADAQDLGSCVHSCRFKSCHPYQSPPRERLVSPLGGIPAFADAEPLLFEEKDGFALR